jgi:ribonuclease T
MKNRKVLRNRFRGFLPVVVDVETTGLDPTSHALIEIAIVTLNMDEEGNLAPAQTFAYHVHPFEGAVIDPVSMEINKIPIDSALRFAITEQEALQCIFNEIEQRLKETRCQRAVWVAHNSWFDLAFIQAAVKRSNFKKIPFHSFTTFDTATLAGVALGETVLARAIRAAGILFDVNEAHSAIYDAEKTAELFCYLVNQHYLIK